jgi:hypothetical protein
MLASSVNEESRYLLPLLPSFVILLLIGARFIARPRLLIVVVVLFGAQWASVHAQAFGLISNSAKKTDWVIRCDPSRERQDETVRLVRLTTRPETNLRYNIVGADMSTLNANSLSFYCSKQRLKTGLLAYYTSLGYAQGNEAAAMQRVLDFRPAYFMSLDELAWSVPDALNLTGPAVLKKIAVDPRFEKIPFQSKFNVVVYRSKDTTAP